MKKTIILVVIIAMTFCSQFRLSAQVFDVDTIIYNGDINKHINFVFIGDGYTSTELNQYITDVQNFDAYLFSQVPFSNYKNYFNVFAIKVISNQSGIKHPGTASDCNAANPLVPVSNPDNYFGCTFDTYGIHRFLLPSNYTAINNVMAANFPNYDQIIILGNSIYYGGGAANNWTACSTKHNVAGEIVSHELGHSLGILADEYWANAASEKANMTKTSDPTTIKWKAWLNSGTGVGIYPFTEDPTWFRPHQNCRMRSLNQTFCSVCIEGLIEKIHNTISPIVEYQPSALNLNISADSVLFKMQLTKPIPNTLKVSWELDGATKASNIDSLWIKKINLTNGTHPLVASVVDTTALSKDSNHPTTHFYIVQWQINKSTTGINVTENNNTYSLSVFPNPISEKLNIHYSLEQSATISFQLISVDGKIIFKTASKTLKSGEYSETFDTSNIKSGIYLLQLKSGDFIANTRIVKK